MDIPVPMTPVTLPRVPVCHAGALLADQRHPTLTPGTLSGSRGPLPGSGAGKAGGRTQQVSSPIPELRRLCRGSQLRDTIDQEPLQQLPLLILPLPPPFPGAFAMWNGTKWSKENLKAKTCTVEAASARGHQYRTGSMDEGGNLSAELLRNQPSIARSLVESLNLTQICFDLLDELQNILDSGAPLPRKAIRKVYLVCLKCCQYLTSSCPHHSKSAAEQSLPVLAANLVTLDLVMHRGNPQLQLGLGIELAVGGQLVYMEKINHWIPEGDICEGCCDECHKPLPRSPGDGEDLQASFFDLSDQGTPAAHPRLDRQNKGAPKHTKGGNTSSANLPSMDPMWCQPPWAWAPYPLALDRLHRAGMEPLPAVDYKGLDQRLRVQCFRELWAKLKKSVRSSILASSGSSAPTGTTDGEQETPSKLWYQPVEQFDAMPMNV
ncbi:uncharacterized protein ACIB01_006218 isoform 1-T1 [Guaruba guarouba]